MKLEKDKKEKKRISTYGHSVSARVYLNPGVETLEHVALVVKIFNGFLLSPDKAFFFAIQPELLGQRNIRVCTG